jgi:predicted transcriptional regulator YheO
MNELKFLLGQYIVLASALTKMYSPFCEVVVHDFSKPQHAIIFIGNSLSGRKVGDPTTNIGLKRIEDPNFPQILQNYQSVLPDGRVLKCTSFGIRNSKGKTIGALCLNFDISSFSNLQTPINQFLRFDNTNVPTKEFFYSSSISQINKYISDFASALKSTTKTLSLNQRKTLLKQMKQNGLFNVKGSIGIAAKLLSISRATIYNIIKE